MSTVKIKSACRVNSAILSFYMCVFSLGVSQQGDMKHSVMVSIVFLFGTKHVLHCASRCSRRRDDPCHSEQAEL